MKQCSPCGYKTPASHLRCKKRHTTPQSSQHLSSVFPKCDVTSISVSSWKNNSGPVFCNTYYFRSNKISCMLNSVLSLEVRVYSLSRRLHLHILGYMASPNAWCRRTEMLSALFSTFIKAPLSFSQRLSQRLSISCPTRANSAALMAESRTFFSATRSTITSGLSSWLKNI